MSTAKKIFLAPFKANITGVVIRIVIFVIIYFIFLHSKKIQFGSGDATLQILILATIWAVIELLIWGSCFIIRMISGCENKPQNNPASPPPVKKTDITGSIDRLINGRACFIILNVSSIPIDQLLINYNYLPVDMVDFKGNGVVFYENYKSVILSCSIEQFGCLINTQKDLCHELIKSLNINQYNNLTLLVSINNISHLDSTDNDLYIKINLCSQFIIQNIHTKLSINFAVDNIASIEGFTALVDINQNPKEDMFGLSFMAATDKYDSVIEGFNNKFDRLLRSLESILLQNYSKDISYYQSAFLFIYQFSYLKEQILRLLECIVIPRKGNFFTSRKQRLVSINFIDSQATLVTNPIIAPKLANYFEEIKARNG